MSEPIAQVADCREVAFHLFLARGDPFERRDALAGHSFEPFLERLGVVGDEFRPVAGILDPRRGWFSHPTDGTWVFR